MLRVAKHSAPSSSRDPWRWRLRLAAGFRGRFGVTFEALRESVEVGGWRGLPVRATATLAAHPDAPPSMAGPERIGVVESVRVDDEQLALEVTVRFFRRRSRARDVVHRLARLRLRDALDDERAPGFLGSSAQLWTSSLPGRGRELRRHVLRVRRSLRIMRRADAAALVQAGDVRAVAASRDVAGALASSVAADQELETGRTGDPWARSVAFEALDLVDRPALPWHFVP